MTRSEKAKSIAHGGEGTVKETVRKPSGNDTLRSNGKADQMKSDLKQAGEKVKDANNN
jgi:uncharacterized protein YjbJ (UPF0337 family)